MVEILCVLFLTQTVRIVQKQNTRNFYHKQMKDGVHISSSDLLVMIDILNFFGSHIWSFPDGYEGGEQRALVPHGEDVAEEEPGEEDQHPRLVEPPPVKPLVRQTLVHHHDHGEREV